MRSRDLAYLLVFAHVSANSIHCALCIHCAGLPAWEQTIKCYSSCAMSLSVCLEATQRCVSYLLHRGSPHLSSSLGWSWKARRRRGHSGTWGRTGRQPHRDTWGTGRTRPHLLPQGGNIRKHSCITHRGMSLYKCTLSARISCTKRKWILVWVVPCKIVCEMNVAQLLQTLPSLTSEHQLLCCGLANFQI